MTSFQVLLNIEHSGITYEPGEEISGLSQKEARQLIEAGAIQGEDADAQDVTQDADDADQHHADAELKPQVGGEERPQSGEQSDSANRNDAKDDAQDVTPIPLAPQE